MMKIFTKASPALLLLVILSFFSATAKGQCTSFYEGFPTTSLDPGWNTTGTYSHALNYINSPVGVYCLQFTGVSGAYDGYYRTFTSGQASYVSYWVMTFTLNANHGAFAIGNPTMPADNGILYSYFTSTGQLRFTNSGTFDYPIAMGTWYHVEAMNIDWGARNLDLYINGTLVQSNWAFPSATCNAVDRIHIFNTSNATAYYDEMRVILAGPSVSNVVITQPSCPGLADGAIDITTTGGTPGYTYNWSSSATTEDITGASSAQNYTVTITDANSCTFVQSWHVNDPPAMVGDVTYVPVTCHDGNDGAANLTVTGGTPGYTYLWSTGATTQNVTGLSPGNVSVTITDAMGCTHVENFFVSNPTVPHSDPTVITDETTISLGAIDITPISPGPACSFLWSNGATTQDISGLSAGTYTVTITCGPCVGIDTFVVNFVPVSTDEALGNIAVTAAPNPFTNDISLFFSSGLNEKASIAITDLAGREVWFRDESYLSETRIVLSPSLTRGMYFLTVRSATDAVTLRVVKE
jgi:hypothetical protein